MIAKNLWRRLTWQRIPIAEIQFRQPAYETKFLLVYSIGYVLFAFVIGWIISISPHPLLGAWKFNQDATYIFIFKIAALLILPGWIYFKKWGYPFSSLLFGWKASARNVLILGAGFTAGLFLNAQHFHKIIATLEAGNSDYLKLSFGLIFPLFTAGLPEELFFRGFLQTHLEKQSGRLTAILLATFLFTAWHLPTRFLLSEGVEGQAGDLGSVLLHTGVPVFIVGFVFALHWDRYRNLPLLIITHWAVDILPYTSSFLGIHF